LGGLDDIVDKAQFFHNIEEKRCHKWARVYNGALMADLNSAVAEHQN
jgi:hypothetical protein